MLNSVILQGRLCDDPELRYTAAQTPVTSFTLAVDRDYSGRDGSERQTDFIPCVAWRKTAEFVSKWFLKGSLAIVSGRLQVRDYKDRDGNPRRATELIAENVYFGESRRAAEAAPAVDPSSRGYVSNPPDYTGGFPAAPRPVDVAPPFVEMDGDQGELPF